MRHKERITGPGYEPQCSTVSIPTILLSASVAAMDLLGSQCHQSFAAFSAASKQQQQNPAKPNKKLDNLPERANFDVGRSKSKIPAIITTNPSKTRKTK